MMFFFITKTFFFFCNKNVLFLLHFPELYLFLHSLAFLPPVFMSLSLFPHFFLVHWHVEREIKIHFEMLARRVFIICKQRCQSCEVNKSIICCISAKSVAFKHSFIKSGQTIVIIFFSCYLFLPFIRSMLVFEEVNLKKLFPPRFNSWRAFFW